MREQTSDGVKRYVDAAAAESARRRAYRLAARSLKFDTLAVHGIYSLDEAFGGGQGGVIEPLLPSTSQAYRDSDEMEAALSYQIPTWCYSRIHNPTTFYLEETLALLECYGSDAEATALCTSSGMSAIKQAVEPLLATVPGERSEISFVSQAQVYGGTFQLFNVRMRERGVEPRWVGAPWDIAEWRTKMDESTRFVYAEMPSNPQQACCDLLALSSLAHEFGIPLVVDATIATPCLMRPFLHGADVVVHSLTKTIGSSGGTIAGAIVARQPVTSRHLAIDARSDYAGWLKLWPFRDSGPCLSPFSAFLLLSDLRTLRIKMQWFSENTMRVARFLSGHRRVRSVDYLGLPTHPLHALASRYMRMVDSGEPAFGHLLSFDVAGTPADARRVFDGFKRIFRATDLGRVKSVATIPAISTHLQQGEEARALAGIPPTMIRLCVGGEHPDDTIADLEQALSAIG